MAQAWLGSTRTRAPIGSSGAVARFRLPGRRGEEYVVRMRQARGRWRIVAVDRDGEPLLLGPADDEPPPASAENGDAVEPAVEEAQTEIPRPHVTALIDESSALVRVTPPPRPRGKRSPFIRRLGDGTWTVQIMATVDAVEADLEREWLDSVGEPAFLEEAEIRGTLWQRVLVGRYPTRADAAETLARLADPAAAEASARR